MDALMTSLVLATAVLAMTWRCRWWVRVIVLLALFPGPPGLLFVWVLIVGDR